MESIKKTKVAYAAFILSFISVIILHFLIKPSVREESKNDEVILRYIDNVTDIQKELIKKFNAEYSGKIKIELINLPLGKFSSHERKQLLTKYLRNKSDQVDVFSVDQVWIPRFYNWAETLDKYFTKAEKEEIEESAYKTCVYGDSLVALPLYIDIGLMYCRDDILQKNPDYGKIKLELQNSITWEKFIELSKTKYFQEYPFYIFSADNYEGLMCSFTELVQSNENFFSTQNSLLKPEIVKAAQFMVDLVQKFRISPVNVTDLQENNFGFYYFENNAVFLRAWPNTFSSFFYKKKELRKTNKLLSLPLPHFKNSDKRFIRGGWNLMVSRFSKKKEAAVEFLKFWIRENMQAMMYEESGFLPSLRKFYENENLLRKYDMIPYYKSLITNSVYRPSTRNYTLFSDILTHQLKQAIKGEITVNEALSKAQMEINSLGINLNQ